MSGSEAVVGEDNSELADMREEVDGGEGHFLEVTYGRDHRGKVRALGSKIAASGRPEKWDGGNCVGVVLRLATYAALEAVRMPLVFHACNADHLLPPCSASSRNALKHTYRIVELRDGRECFV